MYGIKRMVREIERKNVQDIRSILDDMKNDDGETEPFYTGGVEPIRVKKIRIGRDKI